MLTVEYEPDGGLEVTMDTTFPANVTEAGVGQQIPARCISRGTPVRNAAVRHAQTWVRATLARDERPRGGHLPEIAPRTTCRGACEVVRRERLRTSRRPRHARWPNPS